jgi:hypothetical protein
MPTRTGLRIQPLQENKSRTNPSPPINPKAKGTFDKIS